MKILVVEDDTRVAAFINRGLREEGHVVDVAGDAEDGLSHAYVSQYDVIVIDVMLPGRSGFEMTSELLARLRALGRRNPRVEESVLRFADIEMDRMRHEVRRAGRPLDLTPTEFKLLEVLMRDPGRVVRRTEILDRVWGMTFDPGTSLIDVHMAHLRKKLEASSRPRVINTVKAVGFTLSHPDPQ